MQVHVTRVDGGGGIHGHTTDHCDDEAGCNGDEQYFGSPDGMELVTEHTEIAPGCIVAVLP